MTKAYIGVGSNLGDREGNLDRARRMLEAGPQVTFLRSSKVHETDPVGGPRQGKFLNAVWEIETDRRPEELLGLLLEVESTMGRVRSEKNAPREIDLDLLLMGNTVRAGKNLVLPHPRMQDRGFVLGPLAELIPDWVHPGLGKSVRQLLSEVHENPCAS